MPPKSKRVENGCGGGVAAFATGGGSVTATVTTYGDEKVANRDIS
jgi:hypothetical protein